MSDLYVCLPHRQVNCSDQACEDAFDAPYQKVLKLERQNVEFEKLVRSLADDLYATGKALHSIRDASGHELMVIATNAHRQCQVIKGEQPLPAAGEKL